MSFKGFIEIMAYVSVAFMAIEIYLTLNKLWKRKHERVVAESISISAKFFSLLPLVVFTIDYIMSGKAASIISNLLIIFFIFVQIAIGAGTWVAEEKNKSFWALLKQALSLESKEVGDLAGALFHPHNAERILKIISQVALADGVLAPKEREFIQSFADSWNIHIDFDHLMKDVSPETVNYDSIRQTMLDFLNESPPHQQAMQLIDVLTILVKIDGNVETKEEMMLEELSGLVNRYIGNVDKSDVHYVAVVPQSEEQERAILNLVPQLSKKQIAGGNAFVTGPFYSEKYANIVCGQYRILNFFSVAILHEHFFEKEK